MQERNDSFSLTKVAYYMLLIAAVVLIVSMILHFVGIAAVVVEWLQVAAGLILFIMTAVVAWNHCRERSMLCKIVYFIALIAIIISVILPRVM